MVMHGVQKAQMGFAGTQAAFESMGVPGAAVAGPATMIIELVGGALIILGAGTRIVGAIYTLVMLGDQRVDGGRSRALIHWGPAPGPSPSWTEKDHGSRLVRVVASEFCSGCGAA